jgi:serine/threonine-protein kinase
MSPELLQFEEPDRRSDLFSLGVLLFELLTGERLYPNRTGMDGVRRILREPPPDVGEHRDDATPELVQLVFSLLAKDRTHRPADARQVARRAEAILAELVAEEGRLEIADFLQEAFAELRSRERQRVAEAMAGARRAPAIAPVSTLPPPAARGRWRWALVGAAIAMLVAGGIGWRAWSADVADASAGSETPLPPSLAASSRAGSSPRSESAPATAARSEAAPPSEGTAGGPTSVQADLEAVGSGEGAIDAEPDSAARRRARRRADRAERPDRAAMNSLPMWGWQ